MPDDGDANLASDGLQAQKSEGGNLPVWPSLAAAGEMQY